MAARKRSEIERRWQAHGLDCAHLDDTPDIWTLDAVAAETERMAEQIAAHMPDREEHPNA